MINEATKNFIRQHIESDVERLALANKFPKDVDSKIVLAQIKSRQKVKHKLPEIYSNFDFIFPINISVEQSSSEQTARFKASIFDYDSSLDLSGGMGVDSLFFASRASKHIYVETDLTLCQIFKSNTQALERRNIEVVNSDALEYLKLTNAHFDLIYVDPARRSASGGKVILLEESTPNVAEIFKLANGRFERMIIKASPMLDISRALKFLPEVNKVYALESNGECRELLLICDTKAEKNVNYFSVLLKDESTRLVAFSAEPIEITYSMPLEYLYEPSASLMKINRWTHFDYGSTLYKLAHHSHLFTSETLIKDFPGRTFRIVSVMKYDKKQIKDAISSDKANITVRNFPSTVAEIRTKMKFAEGGDSYLFFTTLKDGTTKVIICEKV